MWSVSDNPKLKKKKIKGVGGGSQGRLKHAS